MWLLITFITIWALSPGPVAVMTVHQAHKYGLPASIAVAGGATLTSILMVGGGLLIHTAGFSPMLESDHMFYIERMGAMGIIGMGLYAGYKSLFSQPDDTTETSVDFNIRAGFGQGMLVMTTYTPQALIFYNLIVPQSVERDAILTTIVTVGTLKVVLIFGWHTLIAMVATRSQNWLANKSFSTALEVATALLLVALGINILI